jgi:hypothetical protein
MRGDIQKAGGGRDVCDCVRARDSVSTMANVYDGFHYRELDSSLNHGSSENQRAATSAARDRQRRRRRGMNGRDVDAARWTAR